MVSARAILTLRRWFPRATDLRRFVLAAAGPANRPHGGGPELPGGGQLGNVDIHREGSVERGRRDTEMMGYWT